MRETTKLKFREHTQLFEDSTRSVVELEATYEALASHLCKVLFKGRYGEAVRPEMMQVTYLGHDPRDAWDTYAVTIDGYGLVGFTNGPPVTENKNFLLPTEKEAPPAVPLARITKIGRYRRRDGGLVFIEEIVTKDTEIRGKLFIPVIAHIAKAGGHAGDGASNFPNDYAIGVTSTTGKPVRADYGQRSLMPERWNLKGWSLSYVSGLPDAEVGPKASAPGNLIEYLGPLEDAR